MSEQKSKRPTKAELEKELDEQALQIAGLRQTVEVLQGAQDAWAESLDSANLRLGETALSLAESVQEVVNLEDETEILSDVVAILAQSSEALFNQLLFAFQTLGSIAAYLGPDASVPRQLANVVIDTLADEIQKAVETEAFSSENSISAALRAVVGDEVYEEALAEEPCCSGACCGGGC